MEYKYAAFYQDKLQQCHIDTFCNVVSIDGLIIGNLRPGSYMSVIRIYMFTGRFDENDNEIYEGHKLKIDDDTILIVKWNERIAGFSLVYEDESFGDFCSTFIDWNKSRIAGHIRVTQIKESVNESAETN